MLVVLVVATYSGQLKLIVALSNGKRLGCTFACCDFEPLSFTYMLFWSMQCTSSKNYSGVTHEQYMVLTSYVTAGLCGETQGHGSCSQLVGHVCAKGVKFRSIARPVVKRGHGAWFCRRQLPYHVMRMNPDCAPHNYNL